MMDAEEFERAVAQRVEQKMAVYRLVKYKMAVAHGDRSVPAPRSTKLDRLELARIEALAKARDFQARVARKIQAARGADGEYITTKGPTRDEWLAGVGKSVDGFETKDCSPYPKD